MAELYQLKQKGRFIMYPTFSHLHAFVPTLVCGMFTFATGGECEGDAFGLMFVCLSVPACDSKTIALIDLICLHKRVYTLGAVLL